MNLVYAVTLPLPSRAAAVGARGAYRITAWRAQYGEHFIRTAVVKFGAMIWRPV
jgi:hypothetical protein